MKSYSSREIIKLLKADGWYEVNVTGSHHQFKHPTKKGRTTVKHPDQTLYQQGCEGRCSGPPRSFPPHGWTRG